MTSIKKGFRKKFIKVKTAKGRKLSSTKWLQRQLNDPYTILAKEQNYRSRAAFKLLDIEEKFKILNKSNYIADLGAAPGGWSQILSSKYNKNKIIIAVDIQEMEEVPNVQFFKGDFTQSETKEAILQVMSGKKFDLVVSDMAPSTSGHKGTDHLRIINLLEEVLDFTKENLAEGGSLIVKAFQGAESTQLLQSIKKEFSKVKYFKPDSSRKGSKEVFVVALGKN